MNLDDQHVTLSLTLAPQPITSKSMVRVDVFIYYEDGLLSPCMADSQQPPSAHAWTTSPKDSGSFQNRWQWQRPMDWSCETDSQLWFYPESWSFIGWNVACSDSVNPMGKSYESLHPHITGLYTCNPVSKDKRSINQSQRIFLRKFGRNNVVELFFSC